jgi:hypothetical protein
MRFAPAVFFHKSGWPEVIVSRQGRRGGLQLLLREFHSFRCSGTSGGTFGRPLTQPEAWQLVLVALWRFGCCSRHRRPTVVLNLALSAMLIPTHAVGIAGPGSRHRNELSSASFELTVHRPPSPHPRRTVSTSASSTIPEPAWPDAGGCELGSIDPVETPGFGPSVTLRSRRGARSRPTWKALSDVGTGQTSEWEGGM